LHVRRSFYCSDFTVGYENDLRGRNKPMKKFPKQLTVKREKDNNGPDYLVAYENALQATELGVKTTVGIYKLIGTQEIQGVVETRRMKPAR